MRNGSAIAFQEAPRRKVAPRAANAGPTVWRPSVRAGRLRPLREASARQSDEGSISSGPPSAGR